SSSRSSSSDVLPLAVATLVGTLTLSTGARIATLDLQTGTTHVIVSSRHPYFEFVEPSWSPDGRRLAYVREDNRCNRCIVIFVDFGRRTRLVASRAAGGPRGRDSERSHTSAGGRSSRPAEPSRMRSRSRNRSGRLTRRGSCTSPTTAAAIAASCG